MAKYIKPAWKPLGKGHFFVRRKYYDDNCPQEIKEFCECHTRGTTTNACDVLVYAVNGNLALLKHPSGSYWSGIGSTSYSSGWIVVIDKAKGKASGEKEVWDCDKQYQGRPKRADIQALIDKHLLQGETQCK